MDRERAAVSLRGRARMRVHHGDPARIAQVLRKGTRPGRRRLRELGIRGTTVSFVLMGFLLDRFESWELAYLATTLPGLVGVAVTLLLAFERRTVTPGSERTTTMAGWLSLEPLRDRRLMLVIMAYALHTAELFVARLWLPLLLVAALTMTGF